MALKVVWTKEAESQLEDIIEYLEINWTNREIIKFFTSLDKAINAISSKPEQHKQSLRKAGAFEYQLSRHTTLFYTFNSEALTIMLLWPNRMNPKSLR